MVQAQNGCVSDAAAAVSTLQRNSASALCDIKQTVLMSLVADVAPCSALYLRVGASSGVCKL